MAVLSMQNELELIPRVQVLEKLPIGERCSEQARIAVLDRLIRRANRNRSERQMEPLRAIRIGNQAFFRPTFVSELIASL